MLNNIPEQDIDEIIKLLDSYNEAGGSRLKINVVETEDQQGVVEKKYHHGRCDVCSPFANGTPFDVLE